MRTTVLVEGESDRVALETLATLRGRDLAAADVRIVAMGGATGIVAALDRYGPGGAGDRLLGLCDEGESRGIVRAYERIGLGAAAAGFQVCRADLEDELIRCLGADAVLEVIDAQGELASFRRLQRQPAQRLRPVTAQLRRFLSGRSGNKARYARLLVEALPPEHAPAPLLSLLEAI